MSMSKKDFIALADTLRANRPEVIPQFDAYFKGKEAGRREQFEAMLDVLADFCQSRNPHFMRDRWLAYIAGECGPNGGKVKGAL